MMTKQKEDANSLLPKDTDWEPKINDTSSHLHLILVSLFTAKTLW